MKVTISQLQSKLEDIRRVYGDLEIYSPSYHSDGRDEALTTDQLDEQVLVEADGLVDYEDGHRATKLVIYGGGY